MITMEVSTVQPAADVVWHLVNDGFFAAVAAIGFAAISNPPMRAFKYCALIAAAGHMSRFAMMNYAGCGLVAGSLVGAVVVGLLSVFIAPKVKVPPETFSFPSLLPMIPGMYAYRCLQAFIMLLEADTPDGFDRYFYLCASNGIMTLFVVLAMVLGQLTPILIFKRISFSSTRD